MEVSAGSCSRGSNRHQHLAWSALLIGAAFFSCAGQNTPGLDAGLADAGSQVPTKSIVGIATDTPSLSTLVAALKFASDNNDLVTLLDSLGTFTVFAPSNDAFDKLAVELTGVPSAKGADLLTAANQSLVKAILRYHVLSSVVKAAEIPFGKAIASTEGSLFKIDSGNPPVITDGRNRTSNVTSTDILASNGVIHLVDRVLLPADKDIVETAQALAAATPGEFKLLVEAVLAANLQAQLKGPGPFTLFAPTDAAFTAVLLELNKTKDALFADKPLLTQVLTYHVVSGRLLGADIGTGALTTLQAGTFTVDAMRKITDARSRSPKPTIVKVDVLAKNGVIHVIDKVLLPAP
jgi:uncharacterized surface protein with fasciclin (FAS1) repeats